MAEAAKGASGGNGFSFLQIPGNIKQQFLPFVLDPSSPLHKMVASSTELNAKGISP